MYTGTQSSGPNRPGKGHLSWEAYLPLSPDHKVTTGALEGTRAQREHLPGAGSLGSLLPLPGRPGNPQSTSVPFAPGHARRGKEPVCEEDCKSSLHSSSSSQPLFQAFATQPYLLCQEGGEENEPSDTVP